MNAGSHFGEAKKSKCLAGTKRMVKATPKANHKALTLFQAAFALLKGSLKRLGYGNGKAWVWRRYAMLCFPLHKGLGQPENAKSFGVLPNGFLLGGWGFRLPQRVHSPQHACAFTFLNTPTPLVIQ